MMRVPFADLQAQYQAIKIDIDQAIQSVIADTAFIGGKFVQQFEKAFADAYCVNHCIPCANGTDPIYIVLRMLGIGPGDEVITTACSWISTAETISQTGACPVFVDIEPDLFTIDATRIEAAITPHNKTIPRAPVRPNRRYDHHRGHLREASALFDRRLCAGTFQYFGRTKSRYFWPGQHLQLFSG